MSPSAVVRPGCCLRGRLTGRYFNDARINANERERARLTELEAAVVARYVERQSTAGVFLGWKYVHAPEAADFVYGFGPAGIGWKPAAGDWNGDREDTIGLFSLTNGFFFLRNAHAPGPADVVFGYGPANAILGDWDGL